jgi:hypothetical protein
MNHSISIQQAIDLTSFYRSQKDKAISPGFENMLSISETFGRAAIDNLLTESDCVKLRVYYGMDEAFKLHAIIVGVDSNDKDILPPSSTTANGEIVETGIICQPVCPPASPLNS